MTRIFAVVLAIGFALVEGAAPAFACAAPRSTGDCCPDGGFAPCTESIPAGPAATAVACCAEAPSPAHATAISPVRVEYEALTVSGPPDLPIAFGPMLVSTQYAARRDEAFVIASPAVRDGSSTYLRTLRLRL